MNWERAGWYSRAHPGRGRPAFGVALGATIHVQPARCPGEAARLSELKGLADSAGLAIADRRKASSVADALEALDPAHLRVLLRTSPGGTGGRVPGAGASTIPDGRRPSSSTG